MATPWSRAQRAGDNRKNPPKPASGREPRQRNARHVGSVNPPARTQPPRGRR